LPGHARVRRQTSQNPKKLKSQILGSNVNSSTNINKLPSSLQLGGTVNQGFLPKVKKNQPINGKFTIRDLSR